MSTREYPTPNLADPRVRVTMKALTETGHYEETADSFEWLSMEATDVVRAVDAGGELQAIYDVLEDTGLHDTTTEATCAWADAAHVWEALGRPNDEGAGKVGRHE